MNKPYSRRILSHSIGLILIASGVTALILWSWNTSMTVIFGLPSIHFTESIGLVTLALTFSWIIKPGKRRSNHFGDN